VPVVEMLGAWWGLRHVIMETRAKYVWLEGDSMIVVHPINSRRANGGNSDALVRDMIVLTNLVDDFWCSRVMGKGI